MARIFQTGAELGTNLVFPARNGITVVTDRVRNGDYAFKLSSDHWGMVPTPSGTEFFIRLGLFQYTNKLFSIYFREGSLDHLRLVFGSDNRLVTAYRGSTSLATSKIYTVPWDVWNLIEVHGVVDDVNGIATVKVNGSIILDLVEVDTRNGGLGLVDNILFCHTSTYSSWIDDIAVNDTTGDKDNSWVGNGYCVGKKANGVVSAQLVGQDADSTGNHLNVDDLPHDSDTTYNESDVVGERDVYKLEDLALADGEAINAVTVVAIAKLDSAGEGNLKVGCLSDATELQSDAVALSSDAYKAVTKLLPTDPNGGAAWTQSGFNAAKVTVEVA